MKQRLLFQDIFKSAGYTFRQNLDEDDIAVLQDLLQDVLLCSGTDVVKLP